MVRALTGVVAISRAWDRRLSVVSMGASCIKALVKTNEPLSLTHAEPERKVLSSLLHVQYVLSIVHGSSREDLLVLLR